MNTQEKRNSEHGRYQNSREVFLEYIPNYSELDPGSDDFDWNPISNGEAEAEKLLDRFKRSISSSAID